IHRGTRAGRAHSVPDGATRTREAHKDYRTRSQTATIVSAMAKKTKASRPAARRSARRSKPAKAARPAKAAARPAPAMFTPTPAPLPPPDDLDDGPAVTIVGVGASAGGLEAFGALLRALPEDPNLAIVFVQHLAPQHESA